MATPAIEALRPLFIDDIAKDLPECIPMSVVRQAVMTADLPDGTWFDSAVARNALCDRVGEHLAIPAGYQLLRTIAREVPFLAFPDPDITRNEAPAGLLLRPIEHTLTYARLPASQLVLGMFGVYETEDWLRLSGSFRLQIYQALSDIQRIPRENP